MSCRMAPAITKSGSALIRRGYRDPDLGHLQDVLEQTAAVGVMHRQRRRPHAQPVAMLCDDGSSSRRRTSRFGHARDQRLQLPPHLLERPRRRLHAVRFGETVRAILFGIDSTDVLDDQLQPLIVTIRPRLDPHELAGVELLRRPIDAFENAARDRARRRSCRTTCRYVPP